MNYSSTILVLVLALLSASSPGFVASASSPDSQSQTVGERIAGLFTSKEVEKEPPSVVDTTKDTISDAYANTREFIQGAAGNAMGVAVDTIDYVQDKAGNAVDAVTDAAVGSTEYAKDKAGNIKDAVVGESKEAASQTKEYAKETAANAADAVSGTADDMKASL